MIIFKKLFKLPLTSLDAHRLASKNIQNPPLPKEMHEASATLVGKSGVSLLDYWRQQFSAQLDALTSEKTWQRQRAKILDQILTEQGWRIVFVASKKAVSSDAWAHLVDGVELFAKSPKSVWPGLYHFSLIRTCAPNRGALWT